MITRGYSVDIGVVVDRRNNANCQKEIDFVAVKRNEKIYIQVSDDISRAETMERESSPLLSIKDAYPKMIIARTRNPEYQYEGVKVIDIADWLLTK